MKDILIGTHNRHKGIEIAHALQDVPCRFKTLADFPDVAVPEETADTLEGNAILKARAYAAATGLASIADDTGLEVPALGGAPGVYSARYAGEGCSYADNNLKLIRELTGRSGDQRRALFRCVIAYHDPQSQETWTVAGALQGEILETLRGAQGFGYDPVFYVPTLGKSLAELTLAEKNRISHRALALQQAKEKLLQLIQPARS